MALISSRNASSLVDWVVMLVLRSRAMRSVASRWERAMRLVASRWARRSELLVLRSRAMRSVTSRWARISARELLMSWLMSNTIVESVD